MHTGWPILKGIKYTATIWIHPQSFRPEWLQDKPRAMPDPGHCLDNHELCPMWANKGECANNPGYMVGQGNSLGNCRMSCKTCSVCDGNDRQCYRINREKEGYLSLDEELISLGIKVQ
eukprot:TRINITY_DN38729_c0_g1_i2.p2 TRINITY_DN38729_c0_g1~~TRINITY_DN38729_c0_g1_i2.p2  ORF type:complete len:118 (-),score=3.24 TRINITY_DN38729_c0_g1_i2:6-359(-)